MGRLSGFNYHEIIVKLRRAGFQFDRYAKGSHEIWRNPQTRARVTIPHHPAISLRAPCELLFSKQA